MSLNQRATKTKKEVDDLFRKEAALARTLEDEGVMRKIGDNLVDHVRRRLYPRLYSVQPPRMEPLK